MNKLHAHKPRLCRLIKKNQEEPECVVLLQNTEDAIEITFPISGIRSSDKGPYDRWWLRDVPYGDDPDRTKWSYEPPPALLLHDSNGSVALLGCKATGEAKRGGTAGEGTVVADYAVLKATHSNYDQINGMRTTSLAYRRWMNIPSACAFNQMETVQLSKMLNLSARLHRKSPSDLDGHNVHEYLDFHTSSEEPKPWSDHLDLHIGILDLVSIAAWRNCTFREIRVNREDDPMMTIDGSVVGEQWLEVVSHRLPGNDLTDCGGRFLFSYKDLQEGAIDTWLNLRRDYSRAVDYLLRILRSGHTWSLQSAIMSGIALEQLGYLIEKNQKESTSNQHSRLNNRKQLSFTNALDAVLKDINSTPFKGNDVEEWKERCRNVYMGAKHGDRNEPDHLIMLNTLRENLLVLRYWIAQSLGVDDNILASNLPKDPLYAKFRTLK